MKVVGKLLFIYCSAISIFILISGGVFGLIFLPIPLFFGFGAHEIIKKGKDINFYFPAGKFGLLLSVVVLVGLSLFYGLPILSSKNQLPEPQSKSSPAPLVFNKGEGGTIKVILDEGEDFINVRQEPNQASSVIGKAYSEKAYKIVAKENNWYKIMVDEKYGWINGGSAIEM